ncbi:MAG: polysaccharide biosynthesis tyrosine autokinase [Filimonas sp.]|nr:polysaccharide biosynthesis tyrosine autokinase [Filimonas sp.]
MSDLEFDIEEKASSKQAGIDFKRLLRKLLLNIHWIILCGLAGWYASKIYLRYQIPIYQVSSSIYVGNGDFNDNANAVLKSAGLVDNSENNVNNQIFILRSFNLIGQVVDSLQLNIDLYSNGLFKKQPVNLDDFPYKIVAKRKSNTQGSGQYILKLTQDQVIFTVNGSKKEYVGHYGENIILPGSDTVIFYKTDIKKTTTNSEYLFQVLAKETAIGKYQARLGVSSSKQASEMLELAFIDEYPDRAEHILGTLIYYFERSTIDYKNRAIQKALFFLNARIEDVSSEINILEEKIKQYKINNKINDVSTAAGQILTQLKEIDVQKNTLQFNENLLSLIENHIKSYNTRDEIVPNAMSLTDQVLGGMVSTYNQLLLQKRGLKDIGTEKDPVLKRIDGQLEELRKNILKNIQNIRLQYDEGKKFNADQERTLTGKFNSLPDIEKSLAQIDRQLNIKQTLYEFLLQKKEEVGVQLASGDVSGSRLVDSPRNRGLLQPQAKNIYSVGIGIALLIPIGFIFISQLLNKKIQSKRDIQATTDIVIVGEINEVKEDECTNGIIGKANTRSIAAEQYRSLRANLYYLGLSKEKQTILVTSFMRDEGKSFTSLNLADILSQAGKKVIVVEFDLRRPKLSKQIGHSNLLGLSNYLAKGDLPITQIIHRVNGANDHLYMINSGPVPPNPAELLMSERMNDLFTHLKQEFDYIILDSAPVGLVSDTFSLATYADLTLYIVRHQFSLKETLQYLNHLKEQEKLPGIAILINGIKHNSFDYGYGYGYGYSGAGYGYSDDKIKKR